MPISIFVEATYNEHAVQQPTPSFVLTIFSLKVFLISISLLSIIVSIGSSISYSPMIRRSITLCMVLHSLFTINASRLLLPIVYKSGAGMNVIDLILYLNKLVQILFLIFEKIHNLSKNIVLYLLELNQLHRIIIFVKS